jgi:signal transduction histidine kinase
MADTSHTGCHGITVETADMIEATAQHAKATERRWMRGPSSVVARLGGGLVVIMLATFLLSAWWIRRTDHQQALRQATHSGEAAARLLTPAIEAAAGQGDAATLRRLLAGQMVAHARLTTPDGAVVADRDASKITRTELPVSWGSFKPGTDHRTTLLPDQVIMRQVTHVPDRGDLLLELGWPIMVSSADELDYWTGLGLIGAGAMAALLVVYHRSRTGFQAWSVIRHSLLAMARGEASPAALAVSAELGDEATAWNAIVAERQRQQRGMTLDKAKAALDRRAAPRGDLDEVCDAMSQGILLLDDKMHVKYANGAAAVFLQAERGKLMGAEVRSLVPDAAFTQMLDKWQSGAPKRRMNVETQRTGEGAGVIRWSIRPVRREDNGSSMIMIEDITQQRVAEEARNSFVAHATHELRAPLTNIRLYLETCVDEGENDPAMRAKCLNVMGDEVRRLERIISDMLSTAQLDAGSFRLKKDDLRLDEILNSLRVDYEAQAKEKGLTLVFNLPPKLPVLHADRDMVLLALHNLLSNAVKYTPQGGSVTLTTDANESRVAIDVADTGIGIGEKDQQRLFEKFYRAQDKRVASITGTGLGLALARQVTRLHGGDITLQSQLDKGSVFTMTLPLVSPSART